MADSLARRLPAGPRKNLGMRFVPPAAPGETGHKKLVDPQEQKRDFGRRIERALQIIGWSKLRLAQEAGYGEDQSHVSRWIAGIDNPPMAKLCAIPEFDRGFMVASGEQSKARGVVVKSVIEVPA